MSQRKLLLKIINEVGSRQDVAQLLGISYSYLRVMLSGHQQVSAPLVNKIARLSNGKVKPEELRPDIFNI